MPDLVTDTLRRAVARYAELEPFVRYVDPERLLVLGTRGRRGPFGTRAACHFTRFRETADRVSADRRFEYPEVVVGGREVRYLLVFTLPRFLFLTPREQAEDIVHELLHVDPSFGGWSSPLRHGRAFDRRVAALVDEAERRGVAPPKLPGVGRTVYYHRLRPFPHPFRRSVRGARRRFDERDLEVAALRVDPELGLPPPVRYRYECPVCGAVYPRRRRVRDVSCSRCAPRFDPRFRLRLREARPLREPT